MANRANASAIAAALAVGAACVMLSPYLVPALDGAEAMEWHEGVSEETVRSEDLFVVDPGLPNRDRGRVLQIDPVFGTTVRYYDAGYQPDAAVPPDGSRLYLLSSLWVAQPKGWDTRLQVYNTATGRLVNSVPTVHQLMTTNPRYRSKMTMSRSGRYLFVLKLRQDRRFDEFYLATFDTASERFLNAAVDLFDCGDALLMPHDQDTELTVICGHAGTIRRLSLVSDERYDEVDMVLPGRFADFRRSVAIPTVVGASMTLLAGTGKAADVDYQNRVAVMRDGPPGEVQRLIGGQVAQIANGAAFWQTGPSGSMTADEIVKYRPQTGRVEARVRLPGGFYSFTVGSRNRYLYAVSSAARRLTVVDAVTLGVLRSVPIATEFPTFAVTSRE